LVSHPVFLPLMANFGYPYYCDAMAAMLYIS